MTITPTAPVTKYAAVTLANIASRTRVRLVRRGTGVKPPAQHAQHLVSLLAKVPADLTPESEAYEEHVIQRFAEAYCELWLVAPIEGGR